MFYRLQPLSNQQEYIDSLKIIGSLSYLFSESTTPYLYYRIAEKLFCKAFDANDLSRGDIALDASKEKIGIGLKTFLKNNDKTLQKVAEFNKDRHLYEHKSSENLIYVIANLRNERISFAENLSEVTRSLYHCVTRAEGMFYIYEESMLLIDIENINSIQKVKNTIRFNDKQHEYTFSLSKSTLLKRFDTSICQEKFPITIYENPLETIQNCFRQQNEIFQETKKLQDTIYLPLYGKNKIVSPKSGLNQWNALGRKRDPNEIYIPIPSKIHHHKPTFFQIEILPLHFIFQTKKHSMQRYVKTIVRH